MRTQLKGIYRFFVPYESMAHRFELFIKNWIIKLLLELVKRMQGDRHEVINRLTTKSEKYHIWMSTQDRISKLDELKITDPNIDYDNALQDIKEIGDLGVKIGKM